LLNPALAKAQGSKIVDREHAVVSRGKRGDLDVNPLRPTLPHSSFAFVGLIRHEPSLASRAARLTARG